ncbi:hypothetical protein B0H15DRAFT_508868 [Mycena belliarum]|uniref:Uncharacterized protein n=1 Tax=Mycena belliarum TaxID=1033014 RepID=A0AAD6UDU7_9AGAR|nr:hypothetical protein B0H15DRAFT_508868 [Mycena belliae]
MGSRSGRRATGAPQRSSAPPSTNRRTYLRFWPIHPRPGCRLLSRYNIPITRPTQSSRTRAGGRGRYSRGLPASIRHVALRPCSGGRAGRVGGVGQQRHGERASSACGRAESFRRHVDLGDRRRRTHRGCGGVPQDRDHARRQGRDSPSAPGPGTPSPSSPSASRATPSHRVAVAAIAGAVVGGLALLVVALACLRRRRQTLLHCSSKSSIVPFTAHHSPSGSVPRWSVELPGRPSPQGVLPPTKLGRVLESTAGAPRGGFESEPPRGFAAPLGRHHASKAVTQGARAHRDEADPVPPPSYY